MNETVAYGELHFIVHIYLLFIYTYFLIFTHKSKNFAVHSNGPTLFFLLFPLRPSGNLDARSCITCDKVLAELEKIDDDTDSFGVDFVKINDKRLAKQYGIKNFPALTYFRYMN